MKDMSDQVKTSTDTSHPMAGMVIVPTILGNGGNLVELAKQFHKAAFTGSPGSSGSTKGGK